MKRILSPWVRSAGRYFAAALCALVPVAQPGFAQTLVRADGSWNNQNGNGSWGAIANWSHVAPFVPATATSTRNIPPQPAATVIRSGQIISIAITDGGSGYTSAPAVAFNNTGTGGAGATATAVTVGGVVTAINITNRGSNYDLPPVVSFTGGGGTGATATATVAQDWAVNTVTITARGTGYTSAPTVSITGGGGSGATAEAMISNGEVNLIYITNPGSGYTSTPTVTITGGGGSGATATAARTPRVVTCIMTNTGGGYTQAPPVYFSGGGGYTSSPTVVFSGGGGTGAAATAAVANGSVTGFTVTAGGSGYTSAPTVTFTGGGGGTGATAYAIISGGAVTGIRLVNAGGPSGALATSSITNGEVDSITVTAGGAGYTASPSATIPGQVTAVNVVAPGEGYTSVPRVTFSGGGAYASAPGVSLYGGGGTGATATTTIVDGRVTAINVTNGGSGYLVAPTVFIATSSTGVSAKGQANITGGVLTSITLLDPGGASGVVAVPTLNTAGIITSYTVTSRGMGYTANPTVAVEAPTVGGIGSFIHFNNDITGNRTITIDGPRTLGLMTIGDLSGGEDYLLTSGTTGSLTFDMGYYSGGKSFLNKFQGDQDAIDTTIVLNDQLNARVNAGRLTVRGSLTGTGSLVSYGAGTLHFTGPAGGSSLDLWVWNRGNTSTGAQVELGVDTNGSITNAFGGNIRLGNVSFGAAGHAVLQLEQTRTNFDQINDNAEIFVDAITNRWGYFKLMGGSETIGSIQDIGNAVVIENMEGETVNTDAVLTLGGNNTNSYIGGFIRNRSGGSGTGVLGVTKEGTGRLLIQGGNINYTGLTYVNGGTLHLRDTTNFNSNIVTAAGTQVILEIVSSTSTWNFNDQILGGGDLIKQGNGTLNFNSGGIRLDDLEMRAGSLQVNAGVASLHGQKNIFAGQLNIVGDAGLNRNVRVADGLTVGEVTAEGRFGQTGSTFTISGARLSANNVGTFMDAVMEAQGKINITNMALALNSAIVTVSTIAKGNSNNVPSVSVTSAANLIVGSILSSTASGVTIPSNTRIVSVNLTSGIVALDKNVTITNGAALTFTYTTPTDGALRNEYQDFTSITHDGAKYIAVTSDGTVHTSTNGTIWDQRFATPSQDALLAVAWTGERVVAVGAGTNVYTSTDCVNWNIVPKGSGATLNEVISTSTGFTGTLTANGTSVTGVANAATFLPGMPLVGLATVPGTTLEAINVGGREVTLSIAATVTATGVDFGFFKGNTTAGSKVVTSVSTVSKIPTGTTVRGNGIPAATTITLTDEAQGSWTLSATPTTGGASTRLNTLTADLTNGSTTLVNVSNFHGLVEGMTLVGAGLQAGTRILTMDTGASTITLSKEAVVSNTGVPVGIFTGTTSSSSAQVTLVTSMGSFNVGMPVTGRTLQEGTVVQSVNSGASTLTLSKTAFASATAVALGVTKTQVNFTGEVTMGSDTLTNVTNVNSLVVGMPVRGTGITAGFDVKIEEINTGANSVRISLPANTTLLTGATFQAGFNLMAVGNFGAVCSSVDGNDWTDFSSGTSKHLNGLAWSGSRFVAVGSAGLVISSTNGLTWAAQALPVPDGTLVQNNGGNASLLLSNAPTVTATGQGFGHFRANTRASTDYTSTPTVTITGGGGSGATATANVTNGSVVSYTVTNGGTGYTSAPTVSVTGGGGTGATASATVVGGEVTSVNVLSAGGVRSLTGVTGMPGLAAGYYISTNTGVPVGTTITAVNEGSATLTLSTPATANSTNTVLRTFVGDTQLNSPFIQRVSSFKGLAVGMQIAGASISGTATIIAMDPVAGILQISSNATANATTSGLGVYRGTVSNGSVTVTGVSLLGSLQANVAVSASNLESIHWTGSQFVAVGHYGQIQTSADGLAWTVRNSTTGRDLFAVSQSGANILAAGEDGIILRSTDGITWTTARPADSPMTNDVRHVDSLRALYGRTGQTLALGNGGLSSANGTTWSSSLNDSFSGSKNELVITGRSGASGSVLISNAVNSLSGTDQNNSNRIDDGTTLVSRGGLFEFANNGAVANFSETVGDLRLDQGHLTVSSFRAGQVGANVGTSTLTFGSLSRSLGTSIEFLGRENANGTISTVNSSLGENTRNRIFFTQAPTLDDGIIGGYAFLGNDWATYGANGVTALTTYETSTTLSNWTATDNVRVGGFAFPAANSNKTINSLVLTGGTLTLNANRLSIESGGIIAFPSPNTTTVTIAGTAPNGYLTVGTAFDTPDDLNIITTSGTTVITAAIRDFVSVQNLTAAAGASVLSGVNTEGLRVGMAVTGLGFAPGTIIQSIDSSSQVTLNRPTSGAVSGAASASFVGGSVSLTKSGTGLLELRSTNPYTGKTYLNNGTLRFTDPVMLGLEPETFVADQIQLNGGTFQAGHLIPQGSSTPYDDFDVSFVGEKRGITVGLAGARIEVGQSNPDNNNNNPANAIPIVNLTISSPLHALGVLELAVRSNVSLGQQNSLVLGSEDRGNTYVRGIKTEGGFGGKVTVLGNNVVGGLYIEEGDVSLTGDNNFTGPIRVLAGTLTLSGSNQYFGGDLFRDTVTISSGRLTLLSTSALGTEGLDLNMGTGAELRLAGIPQTIVEITGVPTSRITNLNAPSNFAQTELTFANPRNVTFLGQITDGGPVPIKIVKTNTGVLTLTSNSNAFTGGLEIVGGSVSASSLGSIGSASSLGLAISDDPGLLVIDNAVLAVTPVGLQVTNRSFTMGEGANGATLVANGTTQTSRVVFGQEYRDFQNPANDRLSRPIQFRGVGERTLTLAGQGTGDNTFTLELRDSTPNAPTALFKSGTGTWVLNKANPYTGITTVHDGVLTVTRNDAVGTNGTSTAANAVENSFAGNLPLGTPVTFPLFYDTVLPGGIRTNTEYYVVETNGSSFKISATPGGPPLDITSNGSLLKYVANFRELTSTTVDVASDQFTGKLPNGTAITFGIQNVAGSISGTVPAGLETNFTYYVIESNGTTFKVSETLGGPAVDFTATGTANLYYSTSQGANNPGGGVILLGGRFDLQNVNYLTPEPIFFEGGNMGLPAGSEASWAGDLYINASSTITVNSNALLRLPGNILGSRAITQAGEGTVILSGEMPAPATNLANNLRTYSVLAGTLVLDYSSNNNSKLSDPATLVLGGSRRGGNLILSGGAHEEIVGSLNLNAGANKIFRDSGTSVIRLNNVNRQAGSSLYFDLGRIAKVDNLNFNGILGAWALIRDAVTNAFWLIPGSSSQSFAVTANDTTDQINTSPSVHGLTNGTQVRFTTDGTLPAGLTTNTIYYVRDTSPNEFKVALTLGGSVVNFTSPGNGNLVATSQLGFVANATTDTFTTLPVQHKLANGSRVRVSSTGTLPVGLAANTDYYVKEASGTNFRLSATVNGPSVNITSSGSGIHSVETQGVEKRSGSAALTFSANPDFFPGADGNDRIKVAIQAVPGIGPITSTLSGSGTVQDPYLYTVITTANNNSTDAVASFVAGDSSISSILAISKSGDDSKTDTASYGMPGGMFLANGSYDNGSQELDWARNQTNSGDGFVMPSGVYQNNNWGRNQNTNAINAAPRNQLQGGITYTLRFATQVASTINLLGGTNIIQTGGLLVSPTVGENDSTINGPGVLTTENQGNLQNFLLHQYNTQGSLIIGAPIADRGEITRSFYLTGATRRIICGLATTNGLVGGGVGVGMLVTGTGIPANTYIDQVLDGHSISITNDHSYNATRPELTFTGGPQPIKLFGTLPDNTRRRVNGVVVPANLALGIPSSMVSTTDLYIGMPVRGPGIPAGSTITFIYNESDIQISTDHFFTGEKSMVVFGSVTGVEKLGPGSVVLDADSTYTGVTFIADGVLRAQRLTDGGVAGSLGMSNSGVGNLVFNGGELQYVGENSSTNRGFTLAEFASLNIGHERTSVAFTGGVSGTDRLEKNGPGTLVMSGNAGLAEIRVEQGKLLFQVIDTNPAPGTFSPSNFSTTALTGLRLAGGTIELRGTPEGNTNQNFGGQLIIEAGTTEVRATSVAGYNPNNLTESANLNARSVNLSIMGTEELTSVIRQPGGVVRFVENPEPGAGEANILLNIPTLERQRILPWAVYRDTANLLTPEVNNFAFVQAGTGANPPPNGTEYSANIVSAGFVLAHDSGPDPVNPGKWPTSILSAETFNPSEDPTGSDRTFGSQGGWSAGTNRFVNTLRYGNHYDGEISISAGNTLTLVSGAILAAYDVRAGIKQLNGPGNLTGGARATEGRDLIFHNYNVAAPFYLGANVVNQSVVLQGVQPAPPLPGRGGHIASGETTLRVTVDSSGAQALLNIRFGMSVSGPGIPAGTVVTLVDSTFFRIVLSQPATQDVSFGEFTFVDVVNFVQSGVGTTVLSGNNLYTGSTFASGGVLRLNSANAVPGGIGATGGTSALIIEDGVVGLGLSDFTRPLGTGASQVQFKGNGGFAAYGADRVVNFGGLATPDVLRYGNDSFVPDGSSLIFGAHDATHKVTLLNPIDLSAYSQVIKTNDGPAAIEGELAGALSGAGRLIKLGDGTLRLVATSTNTGGVELAQGQLIAANVSNVFGAGGPVRLGTSPTNTTTATALNLVVEGGTVSNPLSVGDVNSRGAFWVAGGQTDTAQDSADLGQHASVALVGGVPAMAYYDATNQDLKYVRALDARGDGWGAPVTVVSAGDVGQFCNLAMINGVPAISYYDATNGQLMFIRATESTGVFWGTPVIVDNAQVSCVEVDADGRVLVGGTFTRIDREPRNRLARLLANGTLDPAFIPQVENGEVRCIQVQPDGRILIAGTFTSIRIDADNVVGRNRIARLNADGTVDTTFNPNLNGDVRVMVLEADGKIMVGGTFTTVSNAATPRNRIARLNSNGTLDTTFSTDIRNGEVRAIARQADDKYVIGGSFTDIGGTTRNRVARVTSTGALESFNPDSNGELRDIVILPSGKILIAGTFGAVNTFTRNRLALLNTDGTADQSFALEVNAEVRDIIQQPDGNLVIMGLFTQVGTEGRNRVARITPAGDVDLTFNPSPNLEVRGMAISPSTLGTDANKIVLGGVFNNVGGLTQQGVARVNVNGTGDATFSRVPDNSGQHNSLTIVGGNPAISFYDGITGDLRYIRANDANGSGWGLSLQFADANNIGVGTAIMVANIGGDLITKDTRNTLSTADDEVTITGTATNGTPIIVYNDVTTNQIKLLVALNATGTDWSTPETIVGAANTINMKVNPLDVSSSLRSHLSLTLVDGSPALAYYDAGTQDLMYTRATNVAGITNNLRDEDTLDILRILVSDLDFQPAWSTPQPLDAAGDVGLFPNLTVINGQPTTAKGTPAITYYDRTNGDLKFIRAQDATGAAWNAPSAVYSTGNVGQVSNLIMTDGVPSVSFYDATNTNILHIAFSDAKGYSRLAFGSAGVWSGNVNLDGTLMIAPAVGQTLSMTGAITGDSGFKLVSNGTLSLTNASNNFGVSAVAPGIRAVSGAEVNGAAVIRSGTLLVGSSGALGATTPNSGATVELGDQAAMANDNGNRFVITVARATSQSGLAVAMGRFDASHNGEAANQGGPGAFVGISPTIDGRTFTVADHGALILVKDEVTHPERNGVYRVVSILPEGAAPGTINLARVLWFDSPSEMLYGTQVRVAAGGGTSAGKCFFLASYVTDVNVTPVHWVEEQANADVSLLASAAGLTIGNAVDINASTNTGSAFLGAASNVTSGQVSFTGSITLQNLLPGIQETRTLNLTSSTSTGTGVTISGPISEANSGDQLSLRKVGTGVLNLSGANSFTGGVVVDQGMLLVTNTTGSATGTGNVTVNAGAVLAGTGTMNSNVTFTGAPGTPATLRVGDPNSTSSAVELLTIQKDVTLGANAVAEFAIGVGNITRLMAQNLSITTTARLVVQLANGFVPTFNQDYDIYDGAVNFVGTVNPTASQLLSYFNLPLEYVWDLSKFITEGKIVALGESEPVDIIDDPDPVVTTQGGNASFTVEYTGTEPATFQWLRNGQPILGATQKTLTLTSVTQASEGNYSVVVTNPRNSDTSASASLTVDWAAQIVTHPTNRTSAVGDPVTFTVGVTGEEPFTYQWRKGTDNIPGANGPSYTINSVSQADAGSYSVVVTNTISTGQVLRTSNSATLTVSVGVASIIDQPQSATVLAGANVVLTASPGGDNNQRRLQWKRNNANIAGATGPTLTLNNITIAQAGDYTLEVSNVVVSTGKASKATSERARVTVVGNPQVVVAAKEGATATITVPFGAPAGLTPTFNWLKNGGPLPADGRFTGGTTKTLTIKKLVLTDTDTYTCVMTGAPGTSSVTGGTHYLGVYNLPPKIDPAIALPQGIVSGAYSYQIPVILQEGAEPPKSRTPATYAATGLPPGLKVDSKTGLITGKPTAFKTGGYSVTVTVTNASGKDSRVVALDILNLPANTAGTYAALIDRHPSASLGAGLGGRLDLTVTGTGTFTGSLNLGAAKLPATGVLDVTVGGNISATVTIRRTGNPLPPPLVLTFGISNNLFTSGAITDGVDTVNFTPGAGWRLTGTPTGTSMDVYAGYHTLGMSLADNDPLVGNNAVPQGSGYATFTVGSSATSGRDGRFTWAGRTPDGDTLTGASFVGPAGQLMLFQYITASRGSILGTMNINAGNPLTTNDNTVSGQVTLARPPATTATARVYRRGYGTANSTSGVTTPISLAVVGGRYEFATTDLLLGLASAGTTIANTELDFMHGGVDVDGDNTGTPVNVQFNPDVDVTIQASNKIVIPKQFFNPAPPHVNPAATSLTATVRSGAFIGKFTLSDDNPVPGGKPTPVKRTATFQGVIIRENGQWVGVGYFMLPQLPAPGSPPTTSTNSSTLSGMVGFFKK